jgi:ABC-type branched-subunit amino acid transport system substrate-binding protein
MKFKKCFTLAVGSLMMLGMLSGCGGTDDTKKTTSQNDKSSESTTKVSEIKLGSVAPLSGHASFLGTELTKGSEAYFKMINDAGGIDGAKIVLEKKDDEYEPAKTVGKATEFVEDDEILSFVDLVGTPTSKEVMPVIDGSEIPAVGFFTGAGFLRDNKANPYVFNIRGSYDQETQKIIDYWKEKGKEKVSIIYQDDAFGSAILSGIEKAMKKYNLEIGQKATIARGELPAQDQIELIANSKPEAVVMVGTAANVSKVIELSMAKGLKDVDFYTVSFVGSEALAKELAKIEVKDATNIIVSQVVPSPLDDSDPLVKEYQESMKKFGATEFNYVSLEGYINAKIMVEALKRCNGKFEREELLTQLKGLNGFDVGGGLKVSMPADIHQMFNDVFLSNLQQGNFVIMK